MTIKERTSTRPVIDLDGPEGNAWNLMGYARSWGKQIGLSREAIDDITTEMMSGDYINLLRVFNDNFGEVLDLETSQPSLLEELSDG